MDSLTLEYLGMGAILVVVGISGLLLPYRWNLLRLRGGISGFFSEETNRRIPKISGILLILLGIIAFAKAALGVML